MFCTKCGEKQEEGSKFCTNCGATLEEVKEEKKTTKKETKKEEPREEVKVEEKKEETGVKINGKVVDTGVKIDGKPVVVETSKEDGKATASLVLGICSIVIFCLSLPLSIVGLILGLVSKEKSGKRTAGIIINAIVLGLSIICIIIYALLFATAGSIIEEEYENNRDNWENIIEDKTEEDDTKYVGNSTYGYVKVPKKWVDFKDVDGTKALQYTDIGDKGYIVTLNTIDQDVTAETAAKAITEGIKGEGATAYSYKKSVGKYDGYVVRGSYTDGTYIDSYIFLTEDGVLRFVSIEGPDRFNDNFEIPQTFTLKK